MSVRPCVCNTSSFYCIHSFRYLIRPLLQLGFRVIQQKQNQVFLSYLYQPKSNITELSIPKITDSRDEYSLSPLLQQCLKRKEVCLTRGLMYVYYSTYEWIAFQVQPIKAFESSFWIEFAYSSSFQQPMKKPLFKFRALSA